MNALRATWYELRADWWAVLALLAVYFFGPDSVIASATVRLYEAAEDRVASSLPQ